MVILMRKRQVLSIAPYYGGKARMAHFICDRLDYSSTDAFVTPFGGMCRVLLNKPRHRVECYNDYSSGLNALMTVLSDQEKAEDFIHNLYEETEFSQEEFDKQSAIFHNAEKDLEQQEKRKIRKLIIDKGIVSPTVATPFLDFFMKLALSESNFSKVEISESIKNGFIRFDNTVKTDEAFKKQFDSLFDNWKALFELKEKQGFIERPTDMGQYVSEMDLAIATYITFLQSRDGMGKTWGKEKFASTDKYHHYVLGLYECAERMQGVHIYQIDAMQFFRRYTFADKQFIFAEDFNKSASEMFRGYNLFNEWISSPNVMMYCDPSYINPNHERKLLEGVDVEGTDSLSEAIRMKYDGKNTPKNLGEVYSRSFGYDEQESFLKCIQNARCKVMISNYDLVLYNKYLNATTGWRREEFLTSTSVGGKSDSARVEVIWYNY